jgi:hypothetical protein
MIDLANSPGPSPLLHTVGIDPGVIWSKAPSVAIDAPPDVDPHPAPDVVWPRDATRTGICGVVAPRVIALANGGYRMYYSQMLPRPGFPAGANDYDNASTRILSAYSADGTHWTPEAGVRMSPQEAGAGEFRAVSSEVVPVDDRQPSPRLRMYFECCAGPQSATNSIRSATSTDGLHWIMEPGDRVSSPGHNYSSPRIVFLEDGRCRLYLYDRGRGIVSLVSRDGLEFISEPGLRVTQSGPFDAACAFAPEILIVQGVGYVMYYAGYGSATRADILRAESVDGLHWKKSMTPVIAPGPGGWDAAKASEMCVIQLPASSSGPPRFRMFYEACDGTAPNARGVWRIAAATAG